MEEKMRQGIITTACLGGTINKLFYEKSLFLNSPACPLSSCTPHALGALWHGH